LRRLDVDFLIDPKKSWLDECDNPNWFKITQTEKDKPRMTVILIIITAAAVGMGMARWLNLPLVPLLVLSGIGIASLNLADDPQLFQDALVLGLTFLVFNFGTEINPDRVERHGRASIFVGLAQFFSLGLIGLGMALLLGWIGCRPSTWPWLWPPARPWW
jgi:Kef-type K+ transport system membrane component KefB